MPPNQADCTNIQTVDKDIQSVLNMLISRARAALIHLQDVESAAIEDESPADLEYREFWRQRMMDELVRSFISLIPILRSQYV
jgi:hypothetical protein